MSSPMSVRVGVIAMKAIFALMALVVLPIVVIDLIGLVWIEAVGPVLPHFIAMVMTPVVSFPAIICGFFFAAFVYWIDINYNSRD